MISYDEKNHVGMGVHACPVCLKEHDEVVLLDTRLKKSLNRNNLMGWKMCPEHQKLQDEGYIALIECSNSIEGQSEGTLSLNNAERTGNAAHVRKEVWESIFQIPAPPLPLVFVEVGVIERLQKLVPSEDAQDSPTNV